MVPDRFSQAVEIARQAGLTIDGIHFYRGTGTNATQAFTDAIDTILSIANLSVPSVPGGYRELVNWKDKSNL